MKTITIFTCAFSLLLLSACGGGSPTTPPDKPSYATGLVYQDPVSTDYRLIKNTGASSSSRLVLDLVGPSGTQGKGVAFFLQADDAKVSWVHPTGASGSHIAAGNVFPLGAAPQLLTDKVQAGQLQVGLFQKGGTATTLASAPILSVALTLKSAQIAKGAVSLAPGSKQAVLLSADGSLTPITISIGTLGAQ